MLVLDSDVLIDIQRGHVQALAWFQSLSETPSVPGLVVMELIQAAQNMDQVRRALKLISPLTVVWPSETDCRRALADFTSFHLSHGLGLIDSLIAACAVGMAGTLCTFNAKHYRVIPELRLYQPYPK